MSPTTRPITAASFEKVFVRNWAAQHYVLAEFPHEELSGAFECLRRLPMKMTTSTRQVGSVMVVDVSGRIELGEESAALRDLVCDLLSKGDKKILLNLGDVQYIDTSGLASLVSAFIRVRKQGGELKLLNLTDKVSDLMQITRLYTVFDVTNDEAAAVKSFGQSTAAIA